MKESRAFKKGYRYISELITQYRLSGKSRLPTILDLASEAGVSHGTISKCIARLTREGILSAKNKEGICIISSSTTTAPQNLSVDLETPESSKKWQRLTREIEGDIRSGIFPAGTALPISKLLAVRYGVSYPTLRKALFKLAEEGIIKNEANRYHITKITTHNVKNKIVFFDRFTNYQIKMRLEQECSRADMYLKVIHVPLGIKLSEAILPKVPKDTLGAVICMARADMDTIKPLLSFLLFKNIPVVYLDLIGEDTYSLFPRNNPYFKIFSVSNSPQSGRQVGKYLQRLEHRKIAFFSGVHEMHWSINRYKGLVESYNNKEKSVVPFVMKNIKRYKKIHTTLLNADTFKNIPQNTPVEKEALINAIHHFRVEIQQQMIWEQFRLNSIPLLEQALEDRKITAWVGANDQIAHILLDFLHARGIAVPEQIAVIGFDDSSIAVRDRITSYNFNFPALAQAIVAYITGSPLKELLHKNKPYIEIEGFITSRDSIGKAPQKET